MSGIPTFTWNSCFSHASGSAGFSLSMFISGIEYSFIRCLVSFRMYESEVSIPLVCCLMQLLMVFLIDSRYSGGSPLSESILSMGLEWKAPVANVFLGGIVVLAGISFSCLRRLLWELHITILVK